MGTGTLNYPPENSLPLGGLLTASKLNQTSGFPTTTFLTVPTTGLYQTACLIHIVSSDGAGTLQLNVNLPKVAPVTTVAFTPTVDSDPISGPRETWANAGDLITASVVAAGLGNTVFNVYCAILRVF